VTLCLQPPEKVVCITSGVLVNPITIMTKSDAFQSCENSCMWAIVLMKKDSYASMASSQLKTKKNQIIVHFEYFENKTNTFHCL